MTYLVVIAWFYVALTMSLAEAFSSQGSVLGAIVTLFLYGIGPIALVVYLMRTPSRRKARKAQEQQKQQQEVPAPLLQPDAGRHAPGGTEPLAVPSVREEQR